MCGSVLFVLETRANPSDNDGGRRGGGESRVDEGWSSMAGTGKSRITLDNEGYHGKINNHLPPVLLSLKLQNFWVDT